MSNVCIGHGDNKAKNPGSSIPQPLQGRWRNSANWLLVCLWSLQTLCSGICKLERRLLADLECVHSRDNFTSIIMSHGGWLGLIGNSWPEKSIPLALAMLPATRFSVVWSDLKSEAVEICFRSLKMATNALMSATFESCSWFSSWAHLFLYFFLLPSFLCCAENSQNQRRRTCSELQARVEFW